jgi:hypothetical protein
MMEKQVFIEKIQKIGDILGYTVDFPENSYDNQAILTHNDITIRIRTGGWKSEGKIMISGSYPHDCHNHSYGYGLKNSSIGCSVDKTPEQIAKDIKRRFLPDYLEDLEKVIEINKNTQKQSDAKYLAIKTIADSLGISPKKEEHNNEYTLPIWNVLPGLDRLEVSHDGARIDLKLELTLEQTLEVLTILKSWK